MELYFVRGAFESQEIYVAERETKDDEFGTPTKLGNDVNQAGVIEFMGSLSADDRTLYFSSWRTGESNIYTATRANTEEEFSNVQSVGALNAEGHIGSPYITSNGDSLYYVSDFGDSSAGYSNIRVASKPEGVEFSDSIPLDINTATDDFAPTVSSDGTILFFSDWVNSNPRPNGVGGIDIWAASKSETGEFSNAFNVGEPLNSQFNDANLHVSSDWPANGATAYFVSNRPGGPGGPGDIWQATWVIPEPSCSALGISASLGLLLYRRRIVRSH